MESRNPNHPRKGSIIRTDALRDPKDIKNIKLLLRGKPRDYAIFCLGLNFGVRGGDLLNMRIGQVRHLKVGDTLTIREQKTRKQRTLIINKTSYEAIQGLLKSMNDTGSDDDFLFQSRKHKGKLTVSYLCFLVKSWGKAINLKVNLGSHSLRRGFGTIQRLVYGTDIATLMRCYGHSSQSQTMKYIGLTEEEVLNTYMHEI